MNGQDTGFQVFSAGILKNNPILVQILGICSTLAVTNSLKNTLVMSIALIFVCAFSSGMVSLLRKLIPGRVRMMVEILIIATGVILVDIILQAKLPNISKQLGPYVGLIITNCIVMGRCEAFALSNPPHRAILDGLGSGSGYSLVLIAIALIREPLGSGTLYGFQVMPGWWQNWAIMVMAPGAFFVLAGLIWIIKSFHHGEECECSK
jgi:Na+-transporting NADH:ubiquinone oxidoreductase subunit D